MWPHLSKSCSGCPASAQTTSPLFQETDKGLTWPKKRSNFQMRSIGSTKDSRATLGVYSKKSHLALPHPEHRFDHCDFNTIGWLCWSPTSLHCLSKATRASAKAPKMGSAKTVHWTQARWLHTLDLFLAKFVLFTQVCNSYPTSTHRNQWSELLHGSRCFIPFNQKLVLFHDCYNCQVQTEMQPSNMLSTCFMFCELWQGEERRGWQKCTH